MRKKHGIYWYLIGCTVLVVVVAVSLFAAWRGTKRAADAPETPVGPLLRVGSYGKVITPYEHFVSSMTYTENGWLAADGFSVGNALDGLVGQLETLVYADDFFCEAADGVTVGTISIFDFETHHRIYFKTSHDVLKELPTGRYYAAVTVSRNGRTIGGKQEKFVYDCTFILEVPEPESAKSAGVPHEIYLQADGKLITPFHNSLSSLFPGGGGAVAADGVSFCTHWEDVAAKIPRVRYTRELSVGKLDSVSYSGKVTILDIETRIPLYEDIDFGICHELPEGEYYVYFTASVRGAYIESIGKNGYSNNEYVFILEVPQA